MAILRLGDKGSNVLVLQKTLKEKSYQNSSDSYFDRQTEQAVKKFQTDNKLYSDGIVGRKTWAALGKKVHTPVYAPPLNGILGRQYVTGMSLSESGIKALFKLESQRKVSNHLHWPQGASGVTLGAGYDMRERTQEEVKNKLLSIGIDAVTASKAAEGVKKTGQDAKDFVKLNKHLINLTEQQEITLLRFTIPAYELMVKNRITVPLTQYEFDALVSFAYNPGGMLNKVTNDINNAKIGDAMATIKSIVRSGKNTLGGLVDRRDSEVRLYLEGKYSL